MIKLVHSSDDLPEPDASAAWEVYRALCLHERDNPDLMHNQYFQDRKRRALRSFQNIFAGG